MSLSLDVVEQLAPDQASLTAARKLVAPKKWSGTETDGSLIWGLCQGSGSNPYRTVFDLRDHGSKCTCPSRKFPCKHALALAWLRATDGLEFGTAERPEWVSDWLSRRRNRPAEDDAEAPPKPKRSLAAAETAHTAEEAAAAEKAADPKAKARSQQQKERNRRKRED